MANLPAKIASSIVAGMLAGTALTMPRDVATAAECLPEPGKDGTQGQHWYYRIEHGTKRHCWYLRGQDGKAAQVAPADESEPAPKAAAQTSANPPRSVEDAHAEYPIPQSRENMVAAPVPGLVPRASAPVAAPPPADPRGSAVSARWPSPENAIAPAAPSLAAPAAAAPGLTAPAPVATTLAPDAAAPLQTTADATDSSSAADATTDASTVVDTPPGPPAAAAPAVPAKPSASLQMLFAVIGGALALAGLTASIVYRLGRRKERRLATSERRAVLWESVESGPRPPWVPPEIEEEPVSLPIPARRAMPSGPVQQRHQKIEEILAQLVRQGQQSEA
ncbi:MAG TPA: hypothetical protein VKY22_04080 [Bradyrhizobium sp.]|nr:hypothetical protein [Bradyrhizobium sp.]